jgi:rhodanese-related sulfurtransferase
MPSTLAQYLEDARSGLDRVRPVDVRRAVDEGAIVVDVRPEEIRRLQGPLPGALVIGLNVLEWRLAPTSEHRVVDLEPGDRVILVCQEGFSSSLAAARLQALGLAGATDVIGGFAALVRHLDDPRDGG